LSGGNVVGGRRLGVGPIRAGLPAGCRRLAGISWAARFFPRSAGRWERVRVAPRRAVRGHPFHSGPHQGTLWVPKPTTTAPAAACPAPSTSTPKSALIIYLVWSGESGVRRGQGRQSLGARRVGVTSWVVAVSESVRPGRGRRPGAAVSRGSVGRRVFPPARPDGGRGSAWRRDGRSEGARSTRGLIRGPRACLNPPPPPLPPPVPLHRHLPHDPTQRRVGCGAGSGAAELGCPSSGATSWAAAASGTVRPRQGRRAPPPARPAHPRRAESPRRNTTGPPEEAQIRPVPPHAASGGARAPPAAIG